MNTSDNAKNSDSVEGAAKQPSTAKQDNSTVTEINNQICVRDCVRFMSGHKITLRNSQTNRSYVNEDSQNETDNIEIHNLIVKYVESKDESLAQFIEKLVSSFDDPLKNANGTFYRGIDKSVKIYSCQIGPSPNPGDGRYNRCGEKCIYLIDDTQFLPQEIKLECSRILIQKYNIPICELEIADVSEKNKNLHNSLKAIFYMTEQGRTGVASECLFEEELHNQGKSKYLISQLLSKAFKICGWDGLYIPGVHGDVNNTYHNLVIFEPAVDKWKEWAVGTYYYC